MIDEEAASATAERRRPRLRVGLVTAKYSPHTGGIETHVAEVARRLPSRGVDPTVLTTRSDRASPSEERKAGVVIRRFPVVPLGADLYVSPALVADLRSNAYDVVHLEGVHTLIAPEVLAHVVRRGTPSIVTFHTGGNSSWLRRLVRGAQWRCLAPLLSRASALVAVSRFEADLFRDVLPASRVVEIVPNGADPPPIGQLDARIPSGAPLVTSIGRLEWYKGHQRAISALPLLRQRHAGAHLVIAGSGPARSRLRDLAARLGVADHVTFVSYGPSERDRLGALLAASDVVALLSSYEANPIAAMEALGLGKPLVVTDATGLAELVEAGLATPVQPGAGPAEVAAALLAGVAGSTGAGTRGSSTGTRWLELPTWDRCTDRLAELYRSVTPSTTARDRSPSQGK